MADPELLSHPLYISFHENWSTRAVGPVLYILRKTSTIPIEEYGYLTVDVLQLKHSHDIFISLEEKQDQNFAYVVCKIESANGKQHIKECYNLALKIEKFLSDIEIK